MKSTEQRRYRTCHLCEAMCGLEIGLSADGSTITEIRGDPEDPLSQGFLCPKAVALQDLHTDSDRLQTPMRRVGPEQWAPVPWPEALDLVAEGLRRVRDAHGADAIAIYHGNPTVHNYGAALFSGDLVRALGTRRRYSATSVDQLPHHIAAFFLFGHQLLLPVPDIDRTDFFLILGANPAASNGSLMSAPDVRRRLEAVRERGGTVVLIDPRRTETARLATQHRFIRPGTDALLLAAMIHTLDLEGRLAPGRLAEFTDGIDDLLLALRPFSPDMVAGHVGISADDIRDLARSFSQAPRAVCYARMGASTQRFGSVSQWLACALNLLTGNLDREGGAMFTRPAADVLPQQRRGSHDRWRSVVRSLPEFGGELPVATLAEDILDAPPAARTRALVTFAGNPVLSTPDGRRLDEALDSLDFMVSIDLYINETSRHADLILPPASPLTRDHFDVVFNLLAVRNYVRYSPPLFPRPADALHDWEIFAELVERLAPARSLKDRTVWAVKRRMGPAGALDYLLRNGPYGAGWALWKEGMSLRMLREHPHGIDLGPLLPCLPQRLFTPDQRIPLMPPLLVEDLVRLREALLEPPPPGLLLIGRRALRSNNSWMHNSERLVRSRRPPCTLLVHPDDAARLGLVHGESARIRSRVGTVRAPVEVSDTIMPGVVSLPHGWGHGRPGVRQRVAQAHAGVSINDLTDPQDVDAVGGNAVLNGVPVEVSPG